MKNKKKTAICLAAALLAAGPATAMGPGMVYAAEGNMMRADLSSVAQGQILADL